MAVILEFGPPADIFKFTFETPFELLMWFKETKKRKSQYVSIVDMENNRVTNVGQFRPNTA